MIEYILNYKNVLESLQGLIDTSPYKKSYIIKSVGIAAPTFYRKLKTLSFTPDETLRIVRLLTPEEANLHDLKQSIEKGKKEYESGKVFSRNDIKSELEELL